MNTGWWVFALAVAAHAALGVAWYSPKMFGLQWAELMGWSPQDIRSPQERKRKAYIWSAIMAAIMAYVLASFFTLVKIDTVSDAIQAGFWFWLGFSAPTGFINLLFADTPKKLWAINAGYHLASLILMGVIIVLLR